MVKTILFMGLSFLILMAGCSGNNPATTDETPVILASGGSFTGNSSSGFHLNLTGVDASAQSADGTQNADVETFLNAFFFNTGEPGSGGVIYGPDRQRIDLMLANPSYDSTNGTLQFDVLVSDGTELPPNLDNVEIRLEDCPDEKYFCVYNELEGCDNGIGPVGTCWSWIGLGCYPCDCDKDEDLCKDANPKCCPDHGGCVPAQLGEHGFNRFCL